MSNLKDLCAYLEGVKNLPAAVLAVNDPIMKAHVEQIDGWIAEIQKLVPAEPVDPSMWKHYIVNATVGSLIEVLKTFPSTMRIETSMYPDDSSMHLEMSLSTDLDHMDLTGAHMESIQTALDEKYENTQVHGIG